MFKFRRFPTPTYLFSIRRMAITHAGFPIRISTDQSLLSVSYTHLAIAAVMQVRIMDMAAMNTVLIIQRMAAGAVGPTEK